MDVAKQVDSEIQLSRVMVANVNKPKATRKKNASKSKSPGKVLPRKKSKSAKQKTISKRLEIDETANQEGEAGQSQNFEFAHQENLARSTERSPNGKKSKLPVPVKRMGKSNYKKLSSGHETEFLEGDQLMYMSVEDQNQFSKDNSQEFLSEDEETEMLDLDQNQSFEDGQFTDAEDEEMMVPMDLDPVVGEEPATPKPGCSYDNENNPEKVTSKSNKRKISDIDEEMSKKIKEMHKIMLQGGLMQSKQLMEKYFDTTTDLPRGLSMPLSDTNRKWVVSKSNRQYVNNKESNNNQNATIGLGQVCK